MQTEPFATDMLDSVLALAIRAWEPGFRSIAEAMDPDVFRHFYPDWRVEQARAVEAAYPAKDMRVWVARVEMRIVGFIAAKPDAAAFLGEIHMVATDPEFQRTGVPPA